MSTRRARIKAVTSLPPRRKNADANDIVKVQAKEIEKSIKSPRTPRNGKTEDIEKSPVTRSSTCLKSPRINNYNVPSVPESIPDDAVMDGIVPLQPITSAPKPIALLKNEIISENAEVLFDPIVPLPSPSKVRPKLRPVPRLAPLRRNSVQGSASESEDESRRALLQSGSGTPALSRQRHDSHTSHSTLHSLPNREVNRARNDSICSSVSQQANVHPPVVASPHKEKHYSKSRRHEQARRAAAIRRRRETVKRDTLTMYDLIFYNPSTNPIVPDQDELELKAANDKVEAAKEVQEASEEDPDDPPENAAPVPQIKLGPNGEIMLDEQSLVIKQSDNGRKVSKDVVHEGGWARGGGAGRYRRTPRTAEWSDAETVRFYRALAALGTDFMLMERLFPGRTRRDLKLKFKKEERVNAAQVDKALRTTSKWDAVRLGDEFQAEREAAERRVHDELERLKQNTREARDRVWLAKELKFRRSRGSIALDSSTLPNKNYNKESNGLTADEIIQRDLVQKQSTKQRRKAPKPSVVSQPKIAPQQLATLTLINTPSSQERISLNTDMATIHKVDPRIQTKPPEILNSAAMVPSNIESGSLVVLTVNDPNSPTKKMLQTYVSQGGGKLTPVALPTSFLNSIVTYMKKGTPKSAVSTSSSPHLTSPSSITSHDSRAGCTSGVVPINGSPIKRQRHSSYTITQL